ncbi:unnamed protein product, partial [Polarella glacialis]
TYPLESLKDETTADFVYVRLHGNNDTHTYRYSDEELQGYAGQLHAWRLRGLDVYCFVLADDAGAAMPQNAKRLQELVHGLAGEALPKGPKMAKQSSLASFFGSKMAPKSSEASELSAAPLPLSSTSTHGHRQEDPPAKRRKSSAEFFRRTPVIDLDDDSDTARLALPASWTLYFLAPAVAMSMPGAHFWVEQLPPMTSATRERLGNLQVVGLIEAKAARTSLASRVTSRGEASLDPLSGMPVTAWILVTLFATGVVAVLMASCSSLWHFSLREQSTFVTTAFRRSRQHAAQQAQAVTTETGALGSRHQQHQEPRPGKRVHFRIPPIGYAGSSDNTPAQSASGLRLWSSGSSSGWPSSSRALPGIPHPTPQYCEPAFTSARGRNALLIQQGVADIAFL